MALRVKSRTYKFLPDTIRRLLELAEADAEETGLSMNQTRVLAKLITEAHARKFGKPRPTKGKPKTTE